MQKTAANHERAAFEWIDLEPEQSDFRSEVLAGLRQSPKTIAAKFFYDERGSELFERITELPEYYLTRTELSILTRHAEEMTSLFGDDYLLIEFGSGSSRKVKLLLEASRASAYMPIDISAEFLRASAQQLHREYPSVPIVAVCADYTRLAELPDIGAHGKRVIFFPGSTVGNLDPYEARRFFAHASSLLEPGDGLLIGADLRKDGTILNAAYNDTQGVTAEFNLNLLRRINREVGANFDLARFEHVAFFNEEQSRIEMHLRTDFAHTVEVGGARFDFAAGEMIHTENSYKYDLPLFHSLFSESRFVPRRMWSDDAGLFSVHYLEVSS
jgi:dimethylhistidine N-methyltransferase